jgi:DNA-binding MarR family transcriptional regulator
MDTTRQVSGKDLQERLRKLTHTIMRHHLHQFHAFGPFVDPHRGQGRVLSILKMKEEITQKELGYLLDMRNQSLGELLNKLEKSGYITRVPSEEDKRTAVIRLTETGKAAAETADSRKDDLGLFDSFTDEERAALYDYLGRITTAFEKHLADNGMELRDSELGDAGELEDMPEYMRKHLSEHLANDRRSPEDKHEHKNI